MQSQHLNNQRLFQHYVQKLSTNDPEQFVQYADKFTKWLSDERALYTDAKPWVSIGKTGVMPLPS
jgi:hypothetical protein